MPRLNSLGDAVQGIAGGVTSINGTVPPSLVGSAGGGWDWLNDTTILGQAGIPSLHSGAWRIYSTTAIAGTATDVSALQANKTFAGGDIYQLWGGYGIATNVLAVPTLPTAGPGSVNVDGLWAVNTNYGTGSGITVYDAVGTVLQQLNVFLGSPSDGSQLGPIRMRGDYLAYVTSLGWDIVSATTGRPIAGYVKQQVVTGLIPVDANGSLVVVEWNAQLSSWTIRDADSGTGLIVNTAPVAGSPTLSFGMDAIYLNGLIRLAWSTGQGENADELVILDVNTETGLTQRGTVVGGIIVFEDGPELEGSRFLLVQAAIVYPPYKDAMNVKTPTGSAISQPWVRYLDSQSQGMTSMQTAANSAQPPVPPATFDAQVLVSTTSTGFPFNRVVQDSATVTWDYSVPNVATASVVGGGGGYVPVSTGAEPLVIVSNGAGAVLLTPYTP